MEILSYFNSAKEAKKEWIDYKELDNIKTFHNLNIKSEPMSHSGIKYANGYIVEEADIKIGLTGDTGFCEGVKKLASYVDVLILDMTQEVGTQSHMGINNILDLLKEYPKLKIIPIHMHDKTRVQAKKLEKENLMILEDGDVLEL